MFGYSLGTTSNSAADTAVHTFSTAHITGEVVALASFKLPAQHVTQTFTAGLGFAGNFATSKTNPRSRVLPIPGVGGTGYGHVRGQMHRRNPVNVPRTFRHVTPAGIAGPASGSTNNSKTFAASLSFSGLFTKRTVKSTFTAGLSFGGAFLKSFVLLLASIRQ